MKTLLILLYVIPILSLFVSGATISYFTLGIDSKKYYWKYYIFIPIFNLMFFYGLIKHMITYYK